MTVGDGGKSYFISGQWDPTIRDLLVLNTETPKGVSHSQYNIQNILFVSTLSLQTGSHRFLAC